MASNCWVRTRGATRLAALMRVLALIQKLPSPAHDGYNLRTAAYLPRLAARHTVALAAFDRGAIESELEQCLAALRRLPERRPPPQSILARAFGALSPDELHDRDPAIEAAIGVFAREFHPDVVWSVGWRMLPYALQIEGVPVLADVVDEGVREAWLACRSRPTPRRFAHLVRVWRFERRHFPRAARVLFVSDQDARITCRVAPRTQCAVLPNGVNVQHFAPDGSAQDPDLLVFEGAMSHVPNAEAVQFFARKVLPRIRAQRPAANLLVVGRDPAPELLELAGPDPRTSGIRFTGFVDDVRPHVRRAAVFVSPMVSGAGLKNKVLQAWALGKAVVATSISTGGLFARSGEDLVVADGAEAFAAACLELLADPARSARLGAAGRRAVCERFSWDRAAAGLEEELAAARSGAPSRGPL